MVSSRRTERSSCIHIFRNSVFAHAREFSVCIVYVTYSVGLTRVNISLDLGQESAAHLGTNSAWAQRRVCPAGPSGPFQTGQGPRACTCRAGAGQ